MVSLTYYAKLLLCTMVTLPKVHDEIPKNNNNNILAYITIKTKFILAREHVIPVKKKMYLVGRHLLINYA